MNTKPNEKTGMVAKKSPAKPAVKPASEASSSPNKPSRHPNNPLEELSPSAALNSPQRKKATMGAKPMRYASYYGDGSDLPLRPGMGPPMTGKESSESWNEYQSLGEKIQNMTQEELHARFPQLKDRKDCHFTEKEAWDLLKGNDEEEARNKRNVNK